MAFDKIKSFLLENKNGIADTVGSAADVISMLKRGQKIPKDIDPQIYEELRQQMESDQQINDLVGKSISSGVMAFNPVIGSAMKIGDLLGDAISSKDEYGISDNDMSAGIGSALSVGQLAGNTVNAIKEDGFQLRDLGYALPGLSGIMENNDAKKKKKQALGKTDAKKFETNALMQNDYFKDMYSQGLKSGGKVKGKGTAKSDSISTSLDPNAFVVPAENADIAMAIGKKVFGWGNNDSADKGGQSNVNLSNGEVVFQPNEFSTLKNMGIDISQLAPNANGGKNFKDGGSVTVNGTEIPRSLLDLIISAESDKKVLEKNGYRSPYNVVVGYGKGYNGVTIKVPKGKVLGELTIKEVMELQKAAIKEYESKGVEYGKRSTSVGAFQGTYGTLKEMIDKGYINEDDKFDKTTQDKFAAGLILEAGYDKVLKGTKTQDDFIDDLSGRWASIPNSKGNPIQKNGNSPDIETLKKAIFSNNKNIPIALDRAVQNSNQEKRADKYLSEDYRLGKTKPKKNNSNNPEGFLDFKDKQAFEAGKTGDPTGGFSINGDKSNYVNAGTAIRMYEDAGLTPSDPNASIEEQLQDLKNQYLSYEKELKNSSEKNSDESKAKLDKLSKAFNVGEKAIGKVPTAANTGPFEGKMKNPFPVGSPNNKLYDDPIKGRYLRYFVNQNKMQQAEDYYPKNIAESLTDQPDINVYNPEKDPEFPQTEEEIDHSRDENATDYDSIRKAVRYEFDKNIKNPELQLGNEDERKKLLAKQIDVPKPGFFQRLKVGDLNPSDINWGTTLGVGQAALGLYNLSKQGDRPQDSISPGFESYLSGLRNEEPVGYTAGQYQTAVNEVENVHQNDVYAIKDLIGGDAGLAMASIAESGRRAMQAKTKIASDDDALYNQNKQAIRNQRANAEFFGENRRSQILKSQMEEFDKNQAAYANLLNAGIGNIVGSQDPLYKKYHDQYKNEA